MFIDHHYPSVSNKNIFDESYNSESDDGDGDISHTSFKR